MVKQTLSIRAPLSISLVSALPLILYGIAPGCGGDDASGSSASSVSSSSASGAGGGGPTCPSIPCTEAGHSCVGGECVADCRKPDAVLCGAGTVCDVSAANPGKCVAPGTPCLTTSEPEPCGDKTCGAGAACDGAGKCYPRVPCSSVACEGGVCFGTTCACEREPGCDPAPLGTVDGAGVGEVGTLHDDAFRGGLVDVEFDPTCGAWGVTLISGTDYLRSMSPAGEIKIYPGITNLNMGEVSVLQRIITPSVAPTANVGEEPGLDVSFSYICCKTCGCMINAVTPQGVARLDPADGKLPIVIPSATYTTGAGPYGEFIPDTGPAGVTYGLDRSLYGGNINENGDYYRLALETKEQTLVAKLPARVYAAAPFDAATMLIAVEGGDLYLLRTTTGDFTKWATSDQAVTGLARDLFEGSIYVSRFDGSVLRYDEAGMSAPFQTTKHPARLSIAPNGWLYAIGQPAPYWGKKPIIERWELPKTR